MRESHRAVAVSHAPRAPPLFLIHSGLRRPLVDGGGAYGTQFRLLRWILFGDTLTLPPLAALRYRGPCRRGHCQAESRWAAAIVSGNATAAPCPKSGSRTLRRFCFLHFYLCCFEPPAGVTTLLQGFAKIYAGKSFLGAVPQHGSQLNFELALQNMPHF